MIFSSKNLADFVTMLLVKLDNVVTDVAILNIFVKKINKIYII